MKNYKITLSFLIFNTALLLFGANNNWIGGASSDWFDGNNWSLGYSPNQENYDNVYIDINQPSQNNLVLEGTEESPAGQYADLVQVGAGGQLTIKNATLNLVNQSQGVRIGSGSGSGQGSLILDEGAKLILSAKDPATTANLYMLIGRDSASGYVNVKAGALLDGGPDVMIRLGDNSQGQMDVQGAVNAYRIYAGFSENGDGTLNVTNGGVLTTSNVLYLAFGAGSTAVMTADNGTVSVGNNFSVGASATATGATANILNGSKLTVGQILYVGTTAGASGLLTVDASTVDTRFINVNNGAMLLQNGSVVTSRNLQMKSATSTTITNSELKITNAGSDQSGNIIGNGGTGQSVLTIGAGGKVTFTNTTKETFLSVGSDTGDGYIIVKDGGILDMGALGTANVGNTSTGKLELANAGSVNGKALYVGASSGGGGTIEMSGSSTLTLSGGLYMGSGAGSSSAITVDASNVNVGTAFSVGVNLNASAASALFTNKSVLTVGDILAVGAAGGPSSVFGINDSTATAGRARISGGSLTIENNSSFTTTDAFEVADADNTLGILSVTDSRLTVGGNLIIAAVGGSTGALNASGADIRVNNNMTVGYGGALPYTATLAGKSSLNVYNELNIGVDGGVAGGFSVSDSTVNTNRFNVINGAALLQSQASATAKLLTLYNSSSMAVTDSVMNITATGSGSSSRVGSGGTGTAELTIGSGGIVQGTAPSGTQYFYVGYDNASGHVTIKDGGRLDYTTGYVNVSGDSATGMDILAGGTLLANRLFIAQNAGQQAFINISGGSSVTVTDTINMATGAGSKADLTIDNSTLTVTGTGGGRSLTLGNADSSSAVSNITIKNKGVLSLAEDLNIGTKGGSSVKMTMDDSTATVRYMELRNGTLDLTGGSTLNVSKYFAEAGTTTTLDNSRLYNSGASEIRIGNGAGSGRAELVLKSGAQIEFAESLSSANFLVGTNGEGYVLVNQGTSIQTALNAAVTNGKFGAGYNAAGTVDIFGTVKSTSGFVADRSNGDGKITVDNGGLWQMTNELYLAKESNANAALTINDGTVRTGTFVSIGELGSGTVNAAITVSGGQLIGGTALYVGRGGNGTLALNSGLVSFRDIEVGNENSPAAGYESYGSGEGTVSLKGGEISASNSFVIGKAAKSGTVKMENNATITANSITVGDGSYGLLEIATANAVLRDYSQTGLTAISGGMNEGMLKFSHAGTLDFQNNVSGGSLTIEHSGSGSTRLGGNVSVYKLELQNGTLAMNDGTANRISADNLTISGGAYAIDILSLSEFDVIYTSGGTLDLAAGILNLTGYAGFEGIIDSEGYRYHIFEGYDPIADSGLSITGYDRANWTAHIDTNGYLVFEAIPEPGTWAAIFGSFALAFAAYRKRGK